MRPEALVAAGGGLGDIVMTTPVISAVYQLGYTIDVLIKPDIAWAAGLLEPWDIVRKVYVGKPPERQYAVVVRAWWHRDVLLDNGPEIKADHISLRTNHEILANMGAVRKLGFVGPTPPTYVPVNGQYTARVLPEHYVAICPGYSGKRGRKYWQRKQWHHWNEFVRCTPSKPFVVLGSTTDKESLPKITGSNVVDLVGTTSLSEAISILSRADFVVALDNGLAHLAAALGKSVFVLFGATSEIKSRPLGREVTVVAVDIPCRPCQMTDAWGRCKDWRCMSSMGPEFVWNIIRESRNGDRSIDDGSVGGRDDWREHSDKASVRLDAVKGERAEAAGKVEA